MAHDIPLRALPLQQRRPEERSVLTERQLKEHGVSAAVITDRCRPGGPWQQLLPKVFLLHPGPPTAEQRLQAVLLYADHGTSRVPAQRPAMITGLAALALHRFAAAPPLTDLTAVDVLVPHHRRLRDFDCVRVRRSRSVPAPVEVAGLACAPVTRALSDAVDLLEGEPQRVRALLVEAAGTGRCLPSAVVRELGRAGLSRRGDVAEAVRAMLTEGRAVAEDRVYELVRESGLPDPVWNVSLHLPDGTYLGAADAYWPEHGVTLEIDMRGPDFGEHDWAREAARRERLEALGLSVLHVTPEKLCDAPDLQAAVVHTALQIAAERVPPSLVVALPR